jgi:hypothetical protein
MNTQEEVTPIKVRTILQYKLTDECWTVQMWGLEDCEICEFKDFPDCGGKEIRKTGKNRRGYTVPI